MKQKFKMPDGELVEKDVPMWKTPWNHDTNFESDRTATFITEPSLTKQEFKDESDINNIIDRFIRGADLPPPILPEHFADISDRPTYFEIQNKLAEAKQVFYALPAETRLEFQNDPSRWADQVVKAVNEGDRDRLEELGLEAPEKPQEPPRAIPSSPSTPAATTSSPGAPGAPASGAPNVTPPK